MGPNDGLLCLFKNLLQKQMKLTTIGNIMGDIFPLNFGSNLSWQHFE